MVYINQVLFSSLPIMLLATSDPIKTKKQTKTLLSYSDSFKYEADAADELSAPSGSPASCRLWWWIMEVKAHWE